MANRVTNEDVIRINEIYYKTKTYAETARQTGFSAGTVKKYVIPGWKPVEQSCVKRFDISTLPDFKEAALVFRGIDNYGELCVYSEEEYKGVRDLWEELTV